MDHGPMASHTMIQEMINEILALRRDQQRLEWMFRHHAKLWDVNGQCVVQWDFKQQKADNFRDAIDQAIKENKHE